MSNIPSATIEAKALVSILRALVLSRNSPPRLRDIMRDYKNLEGRDLDCKRFGYPRLEDFLASSGEFVLTKMQGEVFVTAKRWKESAHISQMISRQKNPKNKKHEHELLRAPKSTDQSWNRTTYSSNVFKNLKSPPKPRITQQLRKGTPHKLDFNKTSNDSNNNTGTKENRNVPDLNKRTQQKVVHQNNNKISRTPARPILGPNSNKNPNEDMGSNSVQGRLQVKKEKKIEEKQQPLENKIVNQKATQNTTSNISSRLQNVRVSEQKQLYQQPQTAAQAQPQPQVQYQPRLPSYQQEQKPVGIANHSIPAQNNNVGLKIRSVQDRLNAHKFDPVIQNTPSSPSEAKEEKNVIHKVVKRENSTEQKVIRRQSVTKCFDFQAIADPMKCLEEYCRFYKYSPPVYEEIKLKFNKKYQGRVLINSIMYSSYPDDYETCYQARIACAKVAIAQIQEEEQAKTQYPICLDSDYEISLKIFDILKDHPHGIFCKNMPDVFKQKYRECLPDSWFSVIQCHPQFFSMEKIAGDNLIIFARLKSANSSAASSASVESDMILNKLVLPWENKYWDLYVTHTVSTIEVWAKLIGKEYTEQLNSLLDEIELLMLTDKVRPSSIVCGQIYLVSDSECWYRVLVQEINKSAGTCLCFFLDEGEEKWFEMEELYVCEPHFLKLPAQAIQFSLFGLEDFAENPNAKRHLDNLLARKPLIGEILTKKVEYDQQIDEDSDTEVKIQVVLYDTSSDDDVNLNPLILQKICDDTPAPELKRYTNVQVTHISKTGEVYLQLKNFGPTYVEKLIRQLVESKFKEDQYKVTEGEITNSGDLFLIYDENRKWFRAVVLRRIAADTFDMFCVDYGFTKTVSISQIFRLNSLSAALSSFPRQAIKVILHNLPPIDDSVIARIRGLLPPNAQTFAKVVVYSVVPQVIIYKRFENDNFFNINDAIYVDYELESEKHIETVSQQQDQLENIVSISRTGHKSPMTVPASPQRTCLPKLEVPLIPNIGEQFNVFISIAPHPGYFYVLPDDQCKKLRDLMRDIQEYYKGNDEFIPADVIEAGEAYAVAASDGTYYRVVVQDIYGPSMVHVCFCDFGDVDVVTNDKLRILPAKFRSLPRLAFVATLYGIKAKDGDWTTEDCLRFKELTEKKRLVSIIRNVSSGIAKNSQVLELDLIDVSTEEDVDIGELLIKEQRADRIEDL